MLQLTREHFSNPVLSLATHVSSDRHGHLTTAERDLTWKQGKEKFVRPSTFKFTIRLDDLRYTRLHRRIHYSSELLSRVVDGVVFIFQSVLLLGRYSLFTNCNRTWKAKMSNISSNQFPP
jgi:hypothetical protein